MGTNKTIFIVRNDENADYDRAQLADYLGRLKAASPPKKFLSREVAKPDRTHVEIIEAKQKDIPGLLGQGFAEI